MNEYRVGIAKGDLSNTKAIARRAIDVAGGFAEAISGARTVLVKPNLTVPGAPGSAICTDLGVTEAVLQLLKEAGIPRIIVADGPGDDPGNEVFATTGYDRLPAKWGVDLLDLNLQPTRTVPVPGGRAYRELDIPEVVLDADAIINIANLKTHTASLATLCAKNLFGLPPTARYGYGSHPRREFHHKGVHKVIHDLNRVARMAYCIIDGTLGMEGNGPIKGEPVRLGVVVAGRNLLAVDTVGCHIMGIDPREVDHLAYLAEAGYGPIDISAVDLSGDPLDSVIRPFARPSKKDP